MPQAFAANKAGDSCAQFGETRINDDHTQIIACLCPSGTSALDGTCVKNGAGANIVWKGTSYEIFPQNCGTTGSVVAYSEGYYYCAKTEVFFTRFPIGELLTGHQACQRIDPNSRCVSQGNAANNYLFCDTAQQDDTGASAGVHCLRFTTP